MPWWMIEDGLVGAIYMIAFIALVVFLSAWCYGLVKPWLIKRQQARAWREQFVQEVLAEGRANFAAALPTTPIEEVVWDEQGRGPQWQGGESFREYASRWASWYTTERE